ncbi:MAG TPA: molybdenum cofactor guanylyltransferase [Vicinamibacterales bacterium]|nr:molybdenum cofactor guanylyltransferase [Vicinamibacterales bacterium]
MDAAILAGGQARRFGGHDKSALLLDGLSILDRQLSVLGEVADRVVVIGGAAGPRSRAAGLEVISDLVPGAGALGGLYTALSAARSPHALVLACDLPFVSRVFLRYLAALAGPAHDAVVPRSRDGLQPLCAVYDRRLAAVLGERIASGRLKVADALAGLRVREVGPAEIASVDPDEKLFLNVNAPADLDHAIRLLHNTPR